MEEDAPKKLNTLQLANYLSVAISTIYRWQKEKGFPRGKRKLGTSEVLWDFDEVAAWKEKYL
jgi:predicted DNA-binding transcriptional regulator AlpA